MFLAPPAVAKPEIGRVIALNYILAIKINIEVLTFVALPALGGGAHHTPAPGAASVRKLVLGSLAGHDYKYGR
jgi:hypothetical protein